MHITTCPTQPQRVFFDIHIGAKAQFAVSAHSVGNGNFESTGLSFDDYVGKMHTEKRKLFYGRRTEVPLWAIRNSDLQRVLVRYLERRAYKPTQQLLVATLPLLERLRRAEQVLLARAPKSEQRLDALCVRYVELRGNGGTSEELAELQSKIAGLDMTLIVNRSPAKIAAAVVYKFYRSGMKSTEIAADLGLNPPGVRQLLYRIQKEASALGYPKPEKITSYRTERALARRRARELRAASQSAAC